MAAKKTISRSVQLLLCVLFLLCGVKISLVTERRRQLAEQEAGFSASLVASPKATTEAVPNSITQFIKMRRAKSDFWQTFRLKPKMPLLGVLLYDENWKQNQGGWHKGRLAVLNVGLFSLFGQQWKSVRRFKISYPGAIGVRMQITAQQMWLDPVTQKSPMFVFQAFTYEEYRRPDGSIVAENSVNGAGDELVLTFPHGLQGFYAVQSFANGYWRASDTLGQGLTYRTTDRHGLLQITTLESLNEEGNPTRISIYEWKQNQFVRVSSVIQQGHN